MRIRGISQASVMSEISDGSGGGGGGGGTTPPASGASSDDEVGGGSGNNLNNPPRSLLSSSARAMELMKGSFLNLHNHNVHHTNAIIVDVENNLVKYIEEVVSREYSFGIGGTNNKVSSLVEVNENHLRFGKSKEADNLLLSGFEKFLDEEGQLGEFLQELSGTPSSSICGKVFEKGEIVFSCRDCWADPSAVLCAECFEHSSHKNHRYKMLKSAGEVCDCGDEEAWRTNECCDVHQTKGGVSEHSFDHHLPRDLENRLTFVFRTLITYAYKMLLCQSHPAIPDFTKFDPNDLWCTVVYNHMDSTDDISDVISLLHRNIRCSIDDATRLAASIHRTGRCVIKVGRAWQCLQTKGFIDDHYSQSDETAKLLTATLMKSQDYFCQVFALKALEWIEELLGKGLAFREIFAEVVAPSQNILGCILEQVLRNDTNLWIHARGAWRHIWIAGFLKDCHLKKQFAMIFARNYSILLKKFVDDEPAHERYSVTSLSAHIFTVPTIAHALMGPPVDLMSTLTSSFLSPSYVQYYQTGRLKWNKRKLKVVMLKCWARVLLDLERILMLPKMDEWTPELEKRFNQGTYYFLGFLWEMQGIDAVTRQTGEHVKYERELETAFAVYSLAESVMNALCSWCCNNRNIFIETFRNCLIKLQTHVCIDSKYGREVTFANHTAFCIEYDISSEPVSLHAPLSRFLANLYLLLPKHELEFTSPEFDHKYKPTQQQLIEPALRAQVFAAQVAARMWKRNGLLLERQVNAYRSDRDQTNMKLKDIRILQMGAALIEPNEFMILVIDRFNLIGWMTSDHARDEEEEKRESAMFGEFLGLIIHIFSTRYVSNVGDVTYRECVQKKIIQYLCVSPMAYSELEEKLIEGPLAESVIREIAVLKPSDNLYYLKEEYHNDYDWHYLRYSQSEMHRAEQQQRERKRFLKQQEIFPPPTLPPFTPMFSPVANILGSDVMLRTLFYILERCAYMEPTSGTDALLRKSLHLIGHGLNEEICKREEEEENENYYSFKFSGACDEWGIWELLAAFLINPTFSQHHDMIRWILAQNKKLLDRRVDLKEVLKLEEVEVDSGSGGGMEAEVEVNLHQESVDKQQDRVAQRKKQLLEQMALAQRKFKAANVDLFADADGDSEASSSQEERARDVELDGLLKKTVALGPNKSPVTHKPESYTCILCKEEEAIHPDSNNFVLASFIQRSSLLCESRAVLRQLEKNDGLADFYGKSEMWIRRNFLLSPHLSSCGHVMHQTCSASYLLDVKFRRENNDNSFDMENQEWPCPLCNQLCNLALPVTMPLHFLQPSRSEKTDDLVLKCMDHLVKREEDVVKVNNLVASFASLYLQPPLAFQIEKLVESFKLLSLKPTTEVNKGVESYRSSREPANEHGPDSPISANDEMEPNNPALSFRMWLRGMKILLCEQREAGSAVELSNDQKLQLFRLMKEGFEEASSCFRRLPSFTNKSLLVFMKQVFAIARDIPYAESSGGPDLDPTLWHAVAYTIMTAEVYHRDRNISFFGQDVAIRYSMVLKFCTRICSPIMDPRLSTFNVKSRSKLVKLLRTIWLADPAFPCILELDAFGLLIQLTYLTPFAIFSASLIEFVRGNRIKMSIQPPTGSRLEHHNLRLAYIIHVYQIIVSVDLEDYSYVDVDSGSDSVAEKVVRDRIFEMWVSPRESSLPPHSPLWRLFPVIRKHLDVDLLLGEVAQKVIPFLRCCAKFYECMTGIPPPPEMTAVESNFQDLTDYLDLPKSIGELFECPEIQEITKRWSAHPSMSVALIPELAATSSNAAHLKSLHKLKIPRGLPQLIELPNNYFELINSKKQKICAKCGQYPENPAVCLVCGICICSINETCGDNSNGKQPKKESMTSSCSSHAHFCGGGNGLFMQPRDCSLLLLSGSKVSVDDIPYTDKHGETDVGLERGNPLTLSRERYESLRRLWIQHEIPQEIARAKERLEGDG